jgi:branched-chain amino acid transport system substrate-binding protein
MLKNVAAILCCSASLMVATAAEAGTYSPGASDSEIVIGNTAPYSGPLSGYGTIGKALAAYFEMVNSQGGVNGRKVRFISADDGYSPPKTVEQTRRLIEQEQVLFVLHSVGTPTSIAAQGYLNSKKVPQLFVSSGATRFTNPGQFPWSIGWQPNYKGEGVAFGKYVKSNVQAPKIAVLYQNDDFGKDYVAGFKSGYGDDVQKNIVAEIAYESSDPTVEAQVARLQATGANVFLNISTGKFASQSLRKVHDLGWAPTQLIPSASSSISGNLMPAGMEKVQGVISAHYIMDPTDPQWQQTDAYRSWASFMDRFYPTGDKKDLFNVIAYSVGETTMHVLRRAGEELTRENIMKAATSMNGIEVPMVIPGIKLTTSNEDYGVIEQIQLVRIQGNTWERFGELIPTR